MTKGLDIILKEYYKVTMNGVSSDMESLSKLKGLQASIDKYGKPAIKQTARIMTKAKPETMLFKLWLEMVAITGRV